MRRNRRFGAIGAVTAAVMGLSLATGAWAYACVAIPGVSLSPGSGPVGTTVKGKATGYSDDLTYSNVEVRWGGANGAIVAQGKPSLGSGTYEFSFKVPDAEPGSYAIYVTQRDESGAPAYGTPSRAVFSVPGAVGSAPREQAPEPETIVIHQQHVVAPATPAAAPPAQPVPLEAQDEITTKVAPGDARSATYEPLSNHRQIANRAPAQLGLAVMAIGLMALLSTAAAVLVVRSARREATYR